MEDKKIRKIVLALAMSVLFITGLICGFYAGVHATIKTVDGALSGSNIYVDIDINESELVEAMIPYIEEVPDEAS